MKMGLENEWRNVVVGVVTMSLPRNFQYPPANTCECCKENQSDMYFVSVPSLINNGWLTKVIEEFNQTTCTQ